MRRFLIGWILVTACGCQRSSTPRFLRIGFLPNITHAQPLVAGLEGTYSQALGGQVKMLAFNSGPVAMEALLSGSVDASFVGAGPAVIAYVRTSGEVKVVTGVVGGGASFIARTISSPQQLHGKRIAAPMIGNTQDISLRHWLGQNGLKTSDLGGDVSVFPLSNPDIALMFQLKQLEAAWVPEPWASRLLTMGGKIVVDERTLWPGGKVPTTVLVVARSVLETRRAEVARLVEATTDLTQQWTKDPGDFARRANAAFRYYSGKELEASVLSDAFSRLIPTTDPMEGQLKEVASHAAALGYIPGGDVEGIVDRSFLRPDSPTVN